jgi:hypothetical protein
MLKEPKNIFIFRGILAFPILLLGFSMSALHRSGYMVLTENRLFFSNSRWVYLFLILKHMKQECLLHYKKLFNL